MPKRILIPLLVASCIALTVWYVLYEAMVDRPVPISPSSTQTAASRPALRDAFAGSASCAECHEERYEEWATSHHARAQRGAQPELDREAFEPTRTVTHGTQTSTVTIDQDRFVIRTIGRDGEQHDFLPAGVIGVAPLWQCIIDDDRGRSQVTELAYDPAQKEWFNVYGDEDRRPEEWGHWTNRGMSWNAMCATCHVTAFDKRYDTKADGYGSKYVEQGVGCESCHGPLRDHVAWQRAHPDGGDDPTLPAFGNEEYFNACGTCHARRSDMTGSFTPGDRFTDHHELILPDATDIFYPDGQVRDEDFEFAPFMLSYMHDIGIYCIECHHSHTGKLRRRGNGLCLECHAEGVTDKVPIDPAAHSHHPEGKGGSFCVDCHMPQTPYMQRHWRRDHGMTIPDPLLTKEHGIPNACTRCHPKEGVDWAIRYVDEWYGRRMDRPTRHRARLLARIKAGDDTALPPLLDRLDAEKNATWRAVYAKFLTPTIERITDQQLLLRVRQALLGLLDDDSTLAQAAAIEALEPFAESIHGRLEPLLDSPSRLVRVKAAWALRRGLDLDTTAARDLLARMHYNEDQPIGAVQGANFLADRGQREPSLPWFEKAIAWEPSVAVYRLRYAAILNTLKRPRDALTQFAEASRLEPTNSLYPYLMGELYRSLDEPESARDAFQAAVARDPRSAQYWHDLATSEAELGRVDEALDALARAEQLQPADPNHPFSRAMLYLRLQRVDDARLALNRVLELAPNHPEATQLLQQLP